MKRIFSVLLLAAMLLCQLVVLAVPIGAETQTAPFAFYEYENEIVTGSNLFTSSATYQAAYGADQRSGYAVSVAKAAYYLVRVNPAAIASLPGWLESVRLYYGDEELQAFSTLVGNEILIYTGSARTLFLDTVLELPTTTFSIAAEIYAVSSFDTVYDAHLTTFGRDMQELFGNMDLSKYHDVAPNGTFVEFITMHEQDISTLGSFELFLYMFNPSGKTVSSGSFDYLGNMASLQVVDGFVMEEADRLYLSDSFVKFKVLNWGYRPHVHGDGTTDTSVRRYDIGNLTLFYEDGSTGYFVTNAFFVVQDQEDASGVKSKRLEGSQDSEIEIEIDYTFYRTETSSEGAYYHNQVDSIYFNVPNHLLNYGELKNVQMSYRRVRTQPIVVLDRRGDAAFTPLHTMAKDRISLAEYLETHDAAPRFWSSDLNVRDAVSSGAAIGTYYKYVFNYAPLKTDNRLSSLCWVFGVDDASASLLEQSAVSADRLLAWAYSYPILAGDTVITGASGQLSGVLFSEIDDVTVINTEDLDLSAASFASNHSGLEELCALGWAYALSKNAENDVLDLSDSIVKIERKSQITDAARNLYYFYGDESKLQTCYSRSKLEESTMFLVRFNVSQYYETDIHISYDGKTTEGYLAETDAYLDLHVLRLDFENKMGVRTQIPVKSNHIDCFAGTTNEQDPSDVEKEYRDDFFDDLTDKWSKFFKIFGVILVVIAVIALVAFVGPLVSPSLKAVGENVGEGVRSFGTRMRQNFEKIKDLPKKLFKNNTRKGNKKK